MKNIWQTSAIIVSSAIINFQNIILKSVKNLLFRRNCALEKVPRTILVFRSSGIGDFVCAMPALKLLRTHYPQARIVLLTTQSANPAVRDRMLPGGLFLADHLVDEKIYLPGGKLTDRTLVEETRNKITQLNPDITFILPFSCERFIGRLKKLLYLRVLGVRRNVYGIQSSGSLKFFPKSQYYAGQFKHQIQAAIAPLQEVGIVTDKIDFNVVVPDSDREIVDQCWKNNNLLGRKVIGMHLGGKLPVQRWPVPNFEDLGKKILELGSDFRIVVVGGREEEDAGNNLIKAWRDGAVNLAGKNTLLQSAEVLRRCTLYVGNDSGPMHLAAAVGTPVVSIFSSYQFPVFWKPWGEKSRIVRHSVPCEFCFPKDGNCPNGTYECIKGITVDEVFNMCLPYLKFN